MSENYTESSTNGLPYFTVHLFLTGDEGSGFHIKNNRSDPWQRRQVIQRSGAVQIRCDCLDVVHGKFSPDINSAFASLVILKFRFDQRRQARRIHTADIKLEFGSISPGGMRPEVHAISLDGQFSLVQTTQTEEIHKEGEFEVGGTGLPGPTVKTNWKWGKTTQGQTEDATTVVGSIDLLGETAGEPNCASWTLLENETQKTGVPEALQVGILLKRVAPEPFQCIVEIEAQADFKTRLEGLFGSTPKDDPVLFRPDIAPTSNLMQYDTKTLGTLDMELKPFCDVTVNTFRGDGNKNC
ncbi:hypothetical protein BP5796_05850 [Coleophoma crateriformis]|uniref:Uncharacterized protein n=1 Tax=Coleophoma crateriformis TaxID=565419 RepID=A0A3D8RVI6_9HELO|nr:hypothetical protein BP5796_05850 [Coleophoma crateriformis]